MPPIDSSIIDLAAQIVALVRAQALDLQQSCAALTIAAELILATPVETQDSPTSVES